MTTQTNLFGVPLPETLETRGQTWTFTVPGKPRAKARPRIVKGQDGRIHTFTPDDKHFTTHVQDRAVAAGLRVEDRAVRISILIHRQMPAWSTRKRLAMNGAICRVGVPDVVNVMANIADALEGVAYNDDRVVMWGNSERRWWNHDETIISVERL